jgi:L-histidine N-alpha-methyltransferase
VNAAQRLPTIERHLPPDFLARSLRDDVVRGLTSTPKWLPPKWFYDSTGSALFEEITRLPEYYQTRTERAILQARAAEIAAATRSRNVVELGAGSATKTRLLLDALRCAGTLERYVPVDVSESALTDAAAALSAEYPGVEVLPVLADFEHQLLLLPQPSERLIVFLGGTIGNFEPVQRAHFLEAARATMGPGDWLLLGTDLVKPPEELVAAYDDAEGVTAEFNRNVLRVLNAELGADFAVDRFEHVALWDAEREWIEMRLRSVSDQEVRIPAVGRKVTFARGEELRTEVSAKFRREGVLRELAAAGLEMTHWWTDEDGRDGRFALSLSRPS